MKHLIYLVVFFLGFGMNAFSQMIDADYVLGGEIEKRDSYESVKTGGSTYRLAFDYGESVLMNKSAVRLIASEQVIRIDFVYSRYRETSDFDQRLLNSKRIESLMEAAPFLFENTSIDWHVVEIAAKPTKEENEKLFHGFVIYARPYVTISDGVYTVSAKPLKRGVEARLLGTELKKLDCYRTEKQMKLKTKKKKGTWTGKYLPNSPRKRNAGMRYESSSIWGRRKEYVRETYVDTVWIEVNVPDTSCECASKSLTSDISMIEPSPFAFVDVLQMDTVVNAVLNRNKSWKKMIIVEDVTGSMYPYTMQTLAWRKLNDRATRAKQFVFFNDGDNKPDGPIGRSGGAYYVNSKDNADVEKVCTTTMSKGGGGMGPENNIEAIIYAQNQNKDAAEIVMVADNWAPVRDMRLLSEVKVPVHIIVCGAFNGNVNIDYLNIALATGGSVHTIEQDFDALSKLNEGEVLKIGDQKFKVKDGRFVLVR